MAETLTQNEGQKQVSRIWKIFWILSVITIVEVVMGIFRFEILTENFLWDMKIQNWIFIILTVVKAYYITWTFMHMEQETPSLRRTVVWTVVFYVSYMIFVFLAEGDYLYDAIHNNFLLWDY